MSGLTPEQLEIGRMFSKLDDEDRELIARLVHLAAAEKRPGVQHEVARMLSAPPRPTTQAENRLRLETVIAYMETRAREQ